MLHQALGGDSWTLDQHILALIHDQLAMANWQRQGKRGRPRPKPISPLSVGKKEAQQFGDTSGRDPEEVKALLHGYRTGAFDHGG